MRGGHKAHLTKMMGEVELLLAGSAPGRDDRLLALKGCLERKSTVIGKLDEEILEEVDAEAIGQEIEVAEETQTEIMETIVKIDHILAREKKRASVEGASSLAKSVPGGINTSAQFKNMKLPKYEIKFDGDPKKYRAFKDSFDVAVVKNTALSNVKKFTYLQSFLQGEAASAVEGLEITDQNFIEAMQILEGRFGNKQLVVNSHMEELV